MENWKDIIGVVHFTKNKFTKTRVKIKANVDFLNDPVVLELGDDYMKISRIGIDFSGKTYNFCQEKSGWLGTTLGNNEIPIGKYYFDKHDSNEDQIIVYF